MRRRKRGVLRGAAVPNCSSGGIRVTSCFARWTRLPLGGPTGPCTQGLSQGWRRTVYLAPKTCKSTMKPSANVTETVPHTPSSQETDGGPLQQH
eukprot:8293599-Pyramimonas_sp.AAC.1